MKTEKISFRGDAAAGEHHYGQISKRCLELIDEFRGPSILLIGAQEYCDLITYLTEANLTSQLIMVESISGPKTAQVIVFNQSTLQLVFVPEKSYLRIVCDNADTMSRDWADMVGTKEHLTKPTDD